MDDSLQMHSSVVRFEASARVFCGLLETSSVNRDIWLGEILVAVAELYTAAHYLPIPNVSSANNYPSEHFAVAPFEYREVLQRLISILNKDRFYADYFDITELLVDPQTPIVGDLADDLADIYRDIKPGLRAWDVNKMDYIAEIIYDWKEPLFRIHWGNHAVNALRALHNFVFI